MEAAKAEFLKEFGDDYGYPDAPKSIDEIRATEFKRLDQNGIVYLDHAGATLYSELQMEAICKDFAMNIYGNPHSQSDSSSTTTDIVREARQQVLEYLNASPREYTCLFTSGATAALKLVGEAFPWSSKSHFMYTMENHNSVLGIREYALSRGASAVPIDIESPINKDPNSIRISKHPIQTRNGTKVMEEEAIVTEGPGLSNTWFDKLTNFMREAHMCNFSGLRFSLDLVKHVKEDPERLFQESPYHKGRWMVLIDAAKGCATNPPDLSKYRADFVVISFYKLFGYPTGLGALVVQKDAAKLLKKTYFSGGTVAASFADMDFVKRREAVEELFEDGTTSFLSIASLRHGFRILNALTPTMIHRHTASLAMYLKKMLLSLKHGNGVNVCTIYGSQTSEESGPTVSFNLQRSDGSWFGYREVEKLTSLSGFQLRTGCFCNPGSCAKYLGLSHLDLLSNLEAGHVCWDDNDVINGKPTGAVRVSFGYMSTFEDAKRFVDFISSSFVSVADESLNGSLLLSKCIPLPHAGEAQVPSAGYYLKSIIIYPIKSCGGFNVKSWPLCSTGLRHDREWLLRSLTGEVLTQKKVPEMCFISTFIDLDQGVMSVESPRCTVKLQLNLEADLFPVDQEEIEVHSRMHEIQHYENRVNLWFSTAVGRPCTLVRSLRYNSCLNRNGRTCRDTESQLSFTNEGQFLLISEESVADLNNRVSSKVQKAICDEPLQVSPMRFRPNLLISGGEPYAEDRWRNLRIGEANFTSLGGCNRCQIINIVQQAGQVQKSNEPLATLASYRRAKGKIEFGILLRCERGKIDEPIDPWLQVGEEVHPDSELEVAR